MQSILPMNISLKTTITSEINRYYFSFFNYVVMILPVNVSGCYCTVYPILKWMFNELKSPFWNILIVEFFSEIINDDFHDLIDLTFNNLSLFLSFLIQKYFLTLLDDIFRHNCLPNYSHWKNKFREPCKLACK